MRFHTREAYLPSRTALQLSARTLRSAPYRPVQYEERNIRYVQTIFLPYFFRPASTHTDLRQTNFTSAWVLEV